MGKIDYSCPLPEEKLVARFKPIFKMLEKHQSATLLALPFTGRTSNLRYILNNKNLLTKLEFSTKNKIIYLVDIDKTNGTHESFISEIIETITQKPLPNNIFADTYLLNKELIKNISDITKNKEIVLILTLNQKSIPFSNDIDRLIVQIQKSKDKFPVTILWSIDTDVYKKYLRSHPSSTFGNNLFFFPTFDKIETEYNVKRLLISKSIEKTDLIKSSFDITGGIAGLFHSYVNLNDSNLCNQELPQAIIKSIKSNIENNIKIIDNLITENAKKVVFDGLDNSTNYKSVKLFSNPTAQEINILNSMIENDRPISRDEIARILWGKSWNSKYSDWAIDKTISRLRKKIVGNEIRILTIKNFGYQLFK